MPLTTTLFSIAVTVSSFNAATDGPARAPVSPIAASIASRAGLTTADTLALTTEPDQLLKPGPGPLAAVSSTRPPALLPLYGSLVAVHGADVYFTARALSSGGSEVNPIMKPVAGKTIASAAVKAATTAAGIYFIERAWKQNRTGAVILAAALNAATTVVVVHNASASSKSR